MERFLNISFRSCHHRTPNEHYIFSILWAKAEHGHIGIYSFQIDAPSAAIFTAELIFSGMLMMLVVQYIPGLEDRIYYISSNSTARRTRLLRRVVTTLAFKE